ncbi:hypothetical protein H696_01723 [Fonticula alba]|uniref:RPA43 OB domain-containing protein n=1 Tax=Fonticula alba TaxID=691883 RepID=A0A058ZEH9_FONAL|nr:hypothetical protein H696_01723 [Fonticula alba]KCV72328.1 hypothetical protein H696_01723 [Fonticula alba]|eukprot:XP_009493906.1 hypothetical protein H696_01723 [Fonticula alba]
MAHGSSKKKAPGAESPFSMVTANLYMHLLPADMGDPRRGIDQRLNAMLLHHSQHIGGTVLSYSDVQFLDDAGKPASSTKNIVSGRIINDAPFIHVTVRAKFLVFKPKVGSQLVGSVIKIGPDQVGMLVLGLFNASIPTENLGSEFAYDYSEGVYRKASKSGSEVAIAVGTRLAFSVQRLDTVNGILAMTGSLRGSSAIISGPELAPHSRSATARLAVSTSTEDLIQTEGSDDPDSDDFDPVAAAMADAASEIRSAANKSTDKKKSKEKVSRKHEETTDQAASERKSKKSRKSSSD